MQKLFCALIVTIFLAACTQQKPVIKTIKDNTIVTIAFGSCSDEDMEQKLWNDVLAEQPDLWIWLGDNIYSDTEDPKVMQAKYLKQKSHPEYQQLLKTCPVIGTWDDHDFGLNDGGKEFRAKVASQDALLDFLDVPQQDIRRQRNGVYSSFDLNTSIANVKILLLDARYFRDKIEKKNGRPVVNLEGTILGVTQWEWLEKELRNSSADIHIFGSGIQVIPEEHRFEKWANFPNERKRLFDLITELKVANPIFISGDRHIGEISTLQWKNQLLYDITSSSLTKPWPSQRPGGE